MTYRMTLSTLEWLRSPEGRELLAKLALEEIDERSLVGHVTRLRKLYPPERAAAALDTTLLRKKAGTKYARAAEMFFVEDALEQASGETVAAHRASRYSGHGPVADLGCGIGGDSIALSRVARVVGYELDELRLAMARANVEAHGIGDRFCGILGDWTQRSLEGIEAAFMDPSRRRDGKRIHSVFQYVPPLSILSELVKTIPHVGVKVSPGVRYGELDRLGVEHEVEIVSERGAVKEAVLWCGDLRTCARRATLLPDGATIIGAPTRGSVPAAAPGRFLYEPDGAVIRAGLVEALASQLGLRKVHPDIAYLTSEEYVATPFARAFEVEEVHKLNLGRLRARLRELKVGDLVVKKRGVDADPDVVRVQLAPRGPNSRVLILTRTPERHVALLCHEVHHVLAG